MKAALIILDGAGLAPSGPGNAVTPETMPYFFAAMDEGGFATLDASGAAVGLEAGMVGNSEVGHLTIGAGRAIPSTLGVIDSAFRNGDWAAHSIWRDLADRRRLHLIGLLSDAGVHGHWRSIVQAACLAVRRGTSEVVVHPVLDGIDSPAGAAPRLLDELEAALAGLPGVALGVIAGRRGFCDRSGDLAPSKAFATELAGTHDLPRFTRAALAAHLPTTEADFPAHVHPGGRPVGAGEPVLITSHRADRARQIARILAENRPVYALVSLGEAVPKDRVFFPTRPLDAGLGFELKRHDLRSLRIAERCKFPHVTYFLNGFNHGLEGEERCIDSIVDTAVAAHPEMSLAAVTAAIVAAMRVPANRAVIANIANLDQVGHLARYDLAAAAARQVDAALQSIHAVARTCGWSLLVTSDHGNAERMIDAEGRGFGAHTEGPVPLIALPARTTRFAWTTNEGTLANVAVSYLAALGIAAPEWMAPSLLERTA